MAYPITNWYNIASQNCPCISLTWHMARGRYIKLLSLNGKVANQCVMNTWMGFILSRDSDKSV